MQTMDVDLGPDRSLHLVYAGEGRDIVLIHGAISTHLDWTGAPFEAVARLGRAIAVDRPGHGLSRRPRFEAGPRAQARQLRDGLRAIGADRPLIVGHSIGGLVALAFAEQFPDSLSGLLLVSPLTFPEIRPIEHSLFAPRSLPVVGPAMSRLLPRAADRALLETIHLSMFVPDLPDESWKQAYPWDRILDPGTMVAEGEDSAFIFPISPEGAIAAREVDIPIEILVGSADLIVSPDRHAHRLAAIMPNARLTTLGGVGHMVHRSRPDAFADALLRALDRAGAVAQAA